VRCLNAQHDTKNSSYPETDVIRASDGHCYLNPDKSLLVKGRPLLRKLVVLEGVVYSKRSLRLEDCAFVVMPKGFDSTAKQVLA